MLSTTRRSRTFRLALVFALVVALSVPSGAFAALEDDWKATSETNPYVGDSSTWRWGWGNKPVINLKFEVIPEDEAAGELAQTDGFIYEFHQVNETGGSAITPLWGAPTTFLSSDKTGALLNQNFNIAALNLREPWIQYTGGPAYGEGLYRVSWLWYNQFRIEDDTDVNTIPFGYDITPPLAVRDLTSTVNALGQGEGWTEASWRDLRWDPDGYDALSGVGGFKISIDSNEVAFAKNVAPNVVYEPYANALLAMSANVPVVRAQLSNVTLEEIPPGKHTIGVTTVDRATNESVVATVPAWVDNDTPTISISSPAANATVGKTATFSVVASDAAGVSAVRYYVDDILVGTATKAPYSLTVDVSAFASGTHTLKAVVLDMIGESAGSWTMPHTAQASRAFKIDRSAPTVSFISGAPNPFYPRKQDGYKDNFVVKFKASEAGTAKLTIKNPKGTTVRTVTKSIGSGTNTISWNGKYTGGTVNSGTFSYRVSMTDKAGNTSSSTASRKVTIKFYELVKTSSNTIKVISR